MEQNPPGPANKTREETGSKITKTRVFEASVSHLLAVGRSRRQRLRTTSMQRPWMLTRSPPEDLFNSRRSNPSYSVGQAGFSIFPPSISKTALTMTSQVGQYATRSIFILRT